MVLGMGYDQSVRTQMTSRCRVLPPHQLKEKTMKPSNYIKEFDYLCDTFPYVLNENIAALIFEYGDIYKRISNDNDSYNPPRAA